MMNWTSFAAFVAMGGYAPYVWGAFGVTAVAMGLELLALRARRRALRSFATAAEAVSSDAASAYAKPGAAGRRQPANVGAARRTQADAMRGADGGATVHVEYREGTA